jgi:coproporphyrinogen III oxidase
VNLHRGEERRGVGGIFFDHLREGDSGLDRPRLLDFLADVGRALPAAYGPIVRRRRDEPYGERERRFQLARRGRYVEFNLVHDRGTVFGLQTNARIESVLMSLPPLAAWDYDPSYRPGSFEAELLAMLEPRDWADLPTTG